MQRYVLVEIVSAECTLGCPSAAGVANDRGTSTIARISARGPADLFSEANTRRDDGQTPYPISQLLGIVSQLLGIVSQKRRND